MLQPVALAAFQWPLSSFLTIMLIVTVIDVCLSIGRRKIANISAPAAAGEILLCIVTGYIGAKLLYAIELVLKGRSFSLHVDGYSFFGAVYLVPVMLFVLSKIVHGRFGLHTDLVTPALIVVLATLRINCMQCGCCGGITYPNGFTVPTQAIEMIGDIIILFVLLVIEANMKNSGMMYPMFLLFYGVLRFVVEFWRDGTPVLLFLHEGQIFAILSILLGGGIVLRYFRRRRAERAAEKKAAKKTAKRRKK